jgi:hypothetical protein
VCTALAGRPGQGAGAAATGGTWGSARAVPGVGGGSALLSVSRGAAGWCGAGGYLTTKSGIIEAAVASQAHGVWGRARVVPGVAGLNKGRYAEVLSVSCVSRGNCAVAGYAFRFAQAGTNTREYATPFVVSQHDGTLAHAQQIPGIGAISKYGYAEVTALSCAAPGNCAAGGNYTTILGPPDGSGPGQAFVVSQVNGTWHRADRHRRAQQQRTRQGRTSPADLHGMPRSGQMHSLRIPRRPGNRRPPACVRRRPEPVTRRPDRGGSPGGCRYRARVAGGRR